MSAPPGSGSQDPELSIIVPLYNEEDNVAPLHAALLAALAPMGRSFEILLVDDGSKDATVARARALLGQGGPLRLIELARNYGQTPAMAAGIDHARGRILITMDGDLQNDPLDIPRLVGAIEAGHDLVVGWRQKRQDHFSRVLPSRIANWLIGRITGVPIKDNGCSLKAYRAGFIKRIPLYAEMHRFIPAMSSLGQARILEIPVRHHPRRFGRSKYGFSRIYKVLLDLLAIKTLLLFSHRPLAWLGGAAALFGLGGGLVLVLALAAMAADPPAGVVLAGTGLLLAALALFLIALGLLSHLVYRTGAARLEPFRLLAVRAATPPSASSAAETPP
jgi:glycosyltransferase involved in cell wall biosynthesis